MKKLIAIVAVPFIWILRLLAELFRHISLGCFWLYDKLLSASIRLNDITEAEVWPKD
jgi:hypothetical protein